MDDVSEAAGGSEPSMEEILASIRRIIADEKDPEAEAAPEGEAADGEDVLELTQMVQEDGSVVDVAEEAPAQPEEPVEVVEEAPAPEPEPEPAPEPAPAFDEGDGILSDTAADAASSSLSALANTVQIERRASSPGLTPLGDGGRTLENMVLELMKPMLKEWLDQNLPAVVDRLVQKEVERIARKVED